jgi:hypothetical protein
VVPPSGIDVQPTTTVIYSGKTGGADGLGCDIKCIAARQVRSDLTCSETLALALYLRRKSL